MNNGTLACISNELMLFILKTGKCRPQIKRGDFSDTLKTASPDLRTIPSRHQCNATNSEKLSSFKVNPCLQCFLILIQSTPNGVPKNCRSRRYFTSSWRGIGKSFQLAIVTPRQDLIGYDTASAQSWYYLHRENISICNLPKFDGG